MPRSAGPRVSVRSASAPSGVAARMRCASSRGFAFAAFAKTAVLGGNRQTERADLGETADHFFWHVGVLTVHVFGVAANHFLAEAPECVLHHLVVAVQVAGPGGGSERRQHFRCAVRVDERVELREVGQAESPRLLAADESCRKVVHHVGHECTGDRGFDASLCSVVEQRTCCLERRARVGEVVRKHLIFLWAAALGESLGRALEQRCDALDHVRRGGEVFCRVGHELQR